MFLYNFLRHLNLNSISPSINNLKSSFLISSLCSLLFFPSSLFLMLCSYEQKISTFTSIFYNIDHYITTLYHYIIILHLLLHMILHKIKLRSNSVLFTDAISLKKPKLWIKLSNNSMAIQIVVRDVFRTQMNIYNGPFWWKYLTV